ncbi:hypothetical protein CYMTET_7474 [Cymbomonas tetramitiformis]|uniref:Uncharacterized protein n=1 Tax=Cymbomonas tetramitiformis TaxID=36881 RepID=A0AAE0LGZ6_9CHLO|nr:hypothetical protein CYMTET_7474 [Cymbomonas tetramitiformis]
MQPTLQALEPEVRSLAQEAEELCAEEQELRARVREARRKVRKAVAEDPTSESTLLVSDLWSSRRSTLVDEYARGPVAPPHEAVWGITAAELCMEKDAGVASRLETLVQLARQVHDQECDLAAMLAQRDEAAAEALLSGVAAHLARLWVRPEGGSGSSSEPKTTGPEKIVEDAASDPHVPKLLSWYTAIVEHGLTDADESKLSSAVSSCQRDAHGTALAVEDRLFFDVEYADRGFTSAGSTRDAACSLLEFCTRRRGCCVRVTLAESRSAEPRDPQDVKVSMDVSGLPSLLGARGLSEQWLQEDRSPTDFVQQVLWSEIDNHKRLYSG